jgi:protein SCO1/2
MKYVAGLAVLFALGVAAQSRDEQTPRELEGVGIVEHLGQKIDLGLEFTGVDGYQHRLAEYFHQGRPVVLNLVYYSCPMLCNLVLNGQTAAFRELRLDIGKDFDVVSISIDPSEDYGLAKSKRATYLTSYGREAENWRFFADYQGNAARLAKQVGFGYRRDPVTGQFAHAAAIYVLSPEGMISRYLYGVRFKPLDLRLALAEAAGGRASAGAKLVLYCFHYDPVARSYVPFAMNLMRAGGALAVLLMGLVLAGLWRRERRHPHVAVVE